MMSFLRNNILPIPSMCLASPARPLLLGLWKDESSCPEKGRRDENRMHLSDVHAITHNTGYNE